MHRGAIRPSAMHRCVLPELCSCVAAVLCTGPGRRTLCARVLCTGVLSAIYAPTLRARPELCSGAAALCAWCFAPVLYAPCLSWTLYALTLRACPKLCCCVAAVLCTCPGRFTAYATCPPPPVHSGAMRPGAMHRCPSALYAPTLRARPEVPALSYAPAQLERYAPWCYAPVSNGAIRPGAMHLRAGRYTPQRYMPAQ